MATPRRRPRISLGFAGGRAGLIASLTDSPQEQLASKANAERQAKEAAAKRSQQYANLARDYDQGAAPYASTITALEAARAAETDEELKGFLDRYIRGAKNTKVTRDVNQKVDDFNTGGITFEKLQADLAAVQTDNELIKSGISKALSGARKVQNDRTITSLTQAYQTGSLELGSYISQMSALRSDPTQKDPNELTKLDGYIASAKQNERSLNDQRVYAKWEAGQMDPDSALAYYAGRIATASDPKDVANLEKFSGNIRTIIKREQANGNAAVGASLKAAVTTAEGNLKDFYANFVKPGVEAAAGNPYRIAELYKEYGNLASSYVPLVGPDAGRFKQMAESALEVGRDVAAKAVTKAVQDRINDIQKSLDEGKKNGTMTTATTISRIQQMAEEASKLEQGGQWGEWTTKEQKGLGNDLRLKAWEQANALADTLMKSKDDAGSKSETSVKQALTFASQAVKGKEESSNLGKALIEANVLGKVNDKWVIDPSRFSTWITSDVEENSALVWDSRYPAGAKYDAGLTKGRDEFVNDIRDSSIGFTQAQGDARKALVVAYRIQDPSFGATRKELEEAYKEADSRGDFKAKVDLANQIEVNGPGGRQSGDALESKKNPFRDKDTSQLGYRSGAQPLADPFQQDRDLMLGMGDGEDAAYRGRNRDGKDLELGNGSGETAPTARDRERGRDARFIDLGQQLGGVADFIKGIFEGDSAAAASPMTYQSSAPEVAAVNPSQGMNVPAWEAYYEPPALTEPAPARVGDSWKWELPPDEEIPASGGGGVLAF